MPRLPLSFLLVACTLSGARAATAAIAQGDVDGDGRADVAVTWTAHGQGWLRVHLRAKDEKTWLSAEVDASSVGCP